MKNIALIAAVVATVAAPAVAQSTSTAFAISHFNQSADHASDVINYSGDTNLTQVSTTGTSPLAETFAILNRSADTPSDMTGLNGATVVGGTPAYGAEIFERLDAE
ncbi:hypothetical protein K3728_07935 [Rhodobacteraceae bacterium M385]|nr:hypothetical protein K3728_07935 [Rhodobacteraceae bacterium M385]